MKRSCDLTCKWGIKFSLAELQCVFNFASRFFSRFDRLELSLLRVSRQSPRRRINLLRFFFCHSALEKITYTEIYELQNKNATK